MPKLPIFFAAVDRLLTEIEASGRREHVLAIGGAGELAPVLRQQFLRAGAEPGAVRLRGPDGADAYVHVLAGAVGDEDVAQLRWAARKRVLMLAVAVGFAGDAPAIPYVLATDVVRVDSGESFPLDAIADAIAGRLGENGAPLAWRIPLLREAFCERLVSSFALRNGLRGAAAWTRRADLPVLALSELRLILRLAQAHGADTARERMPGLAATLGAGLGLRALARELRDQLPVAGWVLKGAVAYAGTHTLGEAARLRFELAATPRPDAASPAAP